MGDSGVLAGVGWTAVLVAAARAVESARTDRICDDPYAAAVVASAAPDPPIPTAPGVPWPGAPDAAVEAFWEVFTSYMGLRTRVFDDALLAAVGGGIRQVVLVAAGLDARPFRLAWPDGTRVFEIDTADVLVAKDELFGDAARCDRRPVAADLRGDWPAALVAAGFDAGRPSAWLAEGLVAYLPAATYEELFARVDELAAPGSAVAVEHFAPLFVERSTAALRGLAAPWGIDIPAMFATGQLGRPHPRERLAAGGWAAHSTPLREIADRHGRSLHVAELSLTFDVDVVTAHRPVG